MKEEAVAFDFEKLRVYQAALEYIDFVFAVTNAILKPGTFSLTDHFRRASVSICLNIAEGSGATKPEFARFLKISRRSIRECVAVTEILYRQKLINLEARSQSRNFCSDLSKMINGLMKSVGSSRSAEHRTPNAERVS